MSNDINRKPSKLDPGALLFVTTSETKKGVLLIETLRRQNDGHLEQLWVSILLWVSTSETN